MKKAIEKDKDLIVEILSSAFHNKELANAINHIVPSKNREKKIKFFAEYLFNVAFKYGEIFYSENRKAALLVVENDSFSLRSMLWKVKLALFCIGLPNVPKVLKRESYMKSNRLQEKHIYPLIMGVKKDHQGRGTAPRLMMEVIQEYKNNSLPVFIETTTDENIKLYEKFGFEIYKTCYDLGYRLVFMKREARV